MDQQPKRPASLNQSRMEGLGADSPDRLSTTNSRPLAVLVAVQLPAVTDDEHGSSVEELGRLADTLGLEVIGRVSQKRDRVEPGAVLGTGKLHELARFTGGTGEVPKGPKKAQKKKEYSAPSLENDEEKVDPDDGDDGPVQEERQAQLVLVDHDLTPSQARNLERASGVEVMDRTSVILSIFHRHARSREAKLEVEIARLRYMAPRLREVGGGGDRQRGGIGGRGAGESSLELDRRKIRDRIAELQRELAAVRKVAETQRSRRAERRKVALVGYTNAGKSSLMRALTGKEVYVADELFATLGTTVRVLPGVTPRVLVSDTVGFIKKLPHDLVASFRATLDEAANAELLLHVVDASDPAYRSQMEVTSSLLGELEVSASKLLLLNKVDQVSAERRRELAAEFPEAILLSAHRESDVVSLTERIARFFDRDFQERELLIPWSESARLNFIHERCRVLLQTSEGAGTRLRIRADAETLSALDDFLVCRRE